MTRKAKGWSQVTHDWRIVKCADGSIYFGPLTDEPTLLADGSILDRQGRFYGIDQPGAALAMKVRDK